MNKPTIHCLVDHHGQPCPGYPEPKNSVFKDGKEMTMQEYVHSLEKEHRTSVKSDEKTTITFTPLELRDLQRECYQQGVKDALRGVAKKANDNSLVGTIKEQDLLSSLNELKGKLTEDTK